MYNNGSKIKKKGGRFANRRKGRAACEPRNRALEKGKKGKKCRGGKA